MQPLLSTSPSGPSRAFLLATMALSGVVFIEPAPFDLLIAAFLVMFIFCGRFSLPGVMQLPLGLLALFLFFNCVSAISASDTAAMANFMIINVYMVTVYLSIAAIVYSWRGGARILLSGYLTSCVLIGCISLLSFFFGYHTDLLFKFDRLSGTFKDPNVFAPFMVMGIIYCIARIEDCSRWYVLLYLLYIVVIALCIVLSASRGAWVNLAVSLLAYMAARFWQGSKSGAGLTRIVLLVLVLLVAAGAVATAVDYAQFDEFLAMRAQVQEYDESRFAVQALGLQLAMSNPVGHGPGQFEVELGSTAWTGSRAAHSLYVRLLFENGFGGFASLVVFLGASLVVAVRLGTAFWRFHIEACVSASSLIGSIVNSAVIDTLHWRHFWIQLGITWGLYVVYRREAQVMASAPDALGINAGSSTGSRPQSLRPSGPACDIAARRAGCRGLFL